MTQRTFGLTAKMGSRKRLNARHEGSGEIHRALRTPHSALRTPHSALRTPHSALRTPHFALRTPHSPFRTPHSALRTPHVAEPGLPLREMMAGLPLSRAAIRVFQGAVCDRSAGLPSLALVAGGKPPATAVWVITALGKAFTAHQLRQVAQFQVSVAQVKALGTAQNPFATAGKPSGTPVPWPAPVVKAFTAAADASATGANAFPTAATEAATGVNAAPTVPKAFTTAAIASTRSAIANPTVPNTISASVSACPAAVRTLPDSPHAFSLTLTLSRWERERLRALSGARRPACLRPRRLRAARRGRTPSFSQREKAGMRENGPCLPPRAGSPPPPAPCPIPQATQP